MNRFVVHGVFWDGPAALGETADGGSPAIALQAQRDSSGAALHAMALGPGTSLGFRVLPGQKYCLGHVLVYSAIKREHVLCPDGAQAVRGYQCQRCFVADNARLIHDFHRGGRVPPGLRDYLMAQHWLYVATFANGDSKVGTASHPRKWNRLAEQGAVVARYIARADDGRVVRLLEDMVTRDVGLAQQVRAVTKTAALTSPQPAGDLKRRNAASVRAAQAVLMTTAITGFDVVDETWVRPRQAAVLCAPGNRLRYPQPLDAGTHGFTVASLSGSQALVRVAGAEVDFVVDLGALKGRLVELGNFTTEVPSLQEALF